MVGEVGCEERALGIPLECGFLAGRSNLPSVHDKGRARSCQGGIFTNSHFPPSFPRRGEWVNAKAQGRNGKGIPAYAGMTGGGAGNGGMGVFTLESGRQR